MDRGMIRLPAATDAERLVLGSVIAFPDCARDIFRALHARDFLDPMCRALYGAMLDQHARGLAFDPRLLASELKTHPEFRDGSSAGYILELGENVATIANLRHYIALVSEASRKRQVLTIAETMRDGAINCQPSEATIRTALADIDELQRAGINVSGAELVCAADVEPEPVEWLWQNRIAIDTVTLIVGDPGLGKSLTTLAITAAVTRGASWPDAPHEEQPSGGVVLLSAEDGLTKNDVARRIVPRLIANGADLSRVQILLSLSDLAKDIDHLAHAIKSTDACRLVVIDPISAYMGKTDTYCNADVRGALKPLVQLAGETHVAVLAVTHLRKGEGPAMYRAMGSLAFVAAARGAWLVAKDKNDEGRRLMLPMKNNIAPDLGTGLAFVIRGDDQMQPVLEWDNGPVTVTADEAVALDRKRPGPSADEHDHAVRFLREALAFEPRPASEVIDEAVNGEGVAKRTLDRARKTLGVKAYRPENPGSWWWRLPGEAGCQAERQTSKCQTTWQSGNVPQTSRFFEENGATNEQVARLPSCTEGES